MSEIFINIDRENPLQTDGNYVPGDLLIDCDTSSRYSLQSSADGQFV